VCKSEGEREREREVMIWHNNCTEERGLWVAVTIDGEIDSNMRDGDMMKQELS
jgi:hypothetical protein